MIAVHTVRAEFSNNSLTQWIAGNSGNPRCWLAQTSQRDSDIGLGSTHQQFKRAGVGKGSPVRDRQTDKCFTKGDYRPRHGVMTWRNCLTLRSMCEVSPAFNAAAVNKLPPIPIAYDPASRY
jgi:hypothetical protein